MTKKEQDRIKKLEARIKMLESNAKNDLSKKIIDQISSNEIPDKMRKLFSQQLATVSEMTLALSKLIDIPEKKSSKSKKKSKKINIK
ncbi:MAG: hypothetical protein P8J51_02155 [Dehalococcoidia bacterium]|nr:hypothetical protein [Dehalococcoidia bacterium]